MQNASTASTHTFSESEPQNHELKVAAAVCNFALRRISVHLLVDRLHYLEISKNAFISSRLVKNHLTAAKFGCQHRKFTHS